MGGTTPGQVGLGYIRKQVGQVTESKAVSSIPPWPLLIPASRLLPWVLTLTPLVIDRLQAVRWSRPFLSQVGLSPNPSLFLVLVFITAPESKLGHQPYIPVYYLVLFCVWCFDSSYTGLDYAWKMGYFINFFKIWCVCVHMYTREFVYGVCTGQKRVPDTLELELKAVVTCQIWVLVMGLGFSGKAGSTFNCWAILQPWIT